MDAFVELDGMGKAVVIGVQGILIIFWVISPIGGFVMARSIRKRSTSVLILALMTLMLNAIFVGLTHILTTEYKMADDTALIIALTTAVVTTSLLGGLSLYLYRDETSAIDQELRNAIDNANPSTDFKFQKRRQERLSKRAKRR